MAKKQPAKEEIEQASLIPDDEHPDYVGGAACDDVDGDCADGDVAVEDGASTADGGAEAARFPLPRLPGIPIFPRFCLPVSGRYRVAPLIGGPFIPRRPSPPIGVPRPIPILPVSIKVRVDVDRYLPQNRISIEATRLFPRSSAHVIAEVTSDRCRGFNNRRVEASITYRDGNASLIPGDRIIFDARRTRGFFYSRYTVRLMQGSTTVRRWNLRFESRYFDPVEFEVDRVANAGTPVTSYDTSSHPNRPATLPSETITLQTAYQRAGFDATMSPNTSVIPTADAGSNGTWSDGEMHNAMVTYWSRFQNRPQWAMWVLYAARHDMGRGLGGIMFDDIGPNHRQGTAIFRDSFIQDAPAGDPNPAAWRRRMEYWTAIHEMGHGFNLAHAWQKSLGSPWIPLANEPEARSFMNYPFRVSGGESSFFSDFRFHFSDQELIFMRHAPRRFVQMGNSDWFVDHGFEAPDAAGATWALELRPNRERNSYAFLEPVDLELKLTNTSNERRVVDEDLLGDGRHVSILVAREGKEPRQWRPFATYCHEDEKSTVKKGESIYGSHLVSATPSGWLIDEPGFYTVQAAVDVDGEIVVSNILRIHVGPARSEHEVQLAPEYFSEDVGRVLAFRGAPSLPEATGVLEAIRAQCADNPAATHAALALAGPMRRDYKVLEADPDDRASMKIRSKRAKKAEGVKAEMDALMKDPDAAAQTLGHIKYFAALNSLADVMDDRGDVKGALQVITSSVKTMKRRGVLQSVIRAAERRMTKYK